MVRARSIASTGASRKPRGCWGFRGKGCSSSAGGGACTSRSNHPEGRRRLQLKTGNRRSSGKGRRRIIYAPGNLVMAARFDLDRLELVSAPVVIIEGIRQPYSSVGAFGCFNSGTCVYVAGTTRGAGRSYWRERDLVIAAKQLRASTVLSERRQAGVLDSAAPLLDQGVRPYPWIDEADRRLWPQP